MKDEVLFKKMVEDISKLISQYEVATGEILGVYLETEDMKLHEWDGEKMAERFTHNVRLVGADDYGVV